MIAKLIRAHLTVSGIPADHLVVAIVKGPGYLKLSIVQLELGICWIDHSAAAGGLGLHL